MSYKKITPSEFYKQIRPEFFSDSEIINQVTLPREYLSFELSKISTNQKQDSFETLCRRLAERFISPNLIPQVGPTGGGDGKTDSETYPVSSDISDRWFSPENGWGKDENWAFAISAKEAWKGKVKSDIKKIVETGRGYSRVYFMSNQLISSKKKKDAQDEFIKEFNVDVVILDGEWILEKVYSNNLINLVVDSLNLSSVFKNEETKLGSNDTNRLKELEELEKNICNLNRYSEYDFQLVEDALQSAILSRMLEKPKDEVEGRFNRALKIGKKLNIKRQLMRIYYQKAWTYINWYDDYALFIENFKIYKSFISKESNISEIEDYCTLFTILYSLKKYNLKDLDIDINIEKKDINNILKDIVNDKNRPTSSLFAKTNLLFFKIAQQNGDVNKIFKELLEIVEQSKNYLDYPFETTCKIIERIFGDIFPDNKELDNLIEKLALVSSKRNSELEAGQIFLRRAIKKLESKNYKESIVYFGKSIAKLAKEETQNDMYLNLLGLGMAYKELGLIWASNNCYILACHFSFKLYNEKGTVSKKTYLAIKEILINELLIGRIPHILIWHEMFLIFNKILNVDENKEEIYFNSFCDCMLSTRLIYTQDTINDRLQYLPDMLGNQNLCLSEDTILYKQGYVKNVIDNYEDISNKNDLDKYFQTLSKQPFIEKMLYDTNFMSEDNLKIHSNVLGCEFEIKFSKDVEMLLIAETLLAFIEGFLGTSLSNVYSHRENIVINLNGNKNNTNTYFTYDENSYEYNFYTTNFNKIEKNSDSLWNITTKFIADIIARNFFSSNIEKHLDKLFGKEELSERLSLIFSYRNSLLNILGDKPKLFFNDWISYCKPKQYKIKREKPVLFNYKKVTKDNKKRYKKGDLEEISHNDIKTQTIIDVPLWDQAGWKGFGFTFHPLEGLGIFLAFKNAISAKKIFDNWKNRIGDIDKEELISIVIVKGINKRHPYWYKIIITINEKAIKLSSTDRILQIPSRVHQMTPKDSKNLNNLISGFDHLKKYKVFPAFIDKNNKVEPFFEKSILKTSLVIKEAWEIGKNDLARVAIKDDDNPIIPEGIKNAPVLEILNEKKSL